MRAVISRPARLLQLDYAPDVPVETLHRMERAARSLGLPLWQVELLGQDPLVAEGFVLAHQRGRVNEYLDALAWNDLDALLRQRPDAAKN